MSFRRSSTSKNLAVRPSNGSSPKTDKENHKTTLTAAVFGGVQLVPANDKQRDAVEIAKRVIWWFYRALKQCKLATSVEQAQLLRERFNRIFKRASMGYTTLGSCSGGCFVTRTGSCAFSNAQKFRSTQQNPHKAQDCARKQPHEKANEARRYSFGFDPKQDRAGSRSCFAEAAQGDNDRRHHEG
jgi:hypothetical protein